MTPRQHAAVKHVRRAGGGSLLGVETLTAILPEWPGGLLQPGELEHAGRLLVRRDAGLGDCLMILPAIRGVKQDHPQLRAEMYVPAEYASLLETFGAVEEAFPLDAWPVNAPQGSASADLSWYVEWHPAATFVDRITLFADALGGKPVIGSGDWRPDADLRSEAKGWIRGNCGPGDEPIVGICLRGKYRHRSWVEEYVFELTSMLANAGRRAIIFDAQPDAPRGRTLAGCACDVVGYAYGLDLPLVAQLVANCDVLVSPDTGLVHLAAAVGTSFVAIYGAIEPRLRLSHYERYRCLTAADEVPCAPCFEDHGHRVCGLECLRAITPLRVCRAIGELLRS